MAQRADIVASGSFVANSIAGRWYGEHVPTDDLYAAYFFGSLNPVRPANLLYDYSGNKRHLTAAGATAGPSVATLSGSASVAVPFTSAEVAAAFGEMTMVTVAQFNAGMATGTGVGIVGDIVTTTQASVVLGQTTTVNHEYTASLRGVTGTEVKAQIAADGVTGTVYEMFAGAFSCGALLTVNTTAGSTAITVTAGVPFIGQAVAGAGIQAGTTIAAVVSAVAGTYLLSLPATATAAGVALSPTASVTAYRKTPAGALQSATASASGNYILGTSVKPLDIGKTSWVTQHSQAAMLFYSRKKDATQIAAINAKLKTFLAKYAGVSA